MSLKYNTIRNKEDKVVIEIFLNEEIIAILEQKDVGILTLVQKFELNTALLSVILDDLVKSSYEIANAGLRFELDF